MHCLAIVQARMSSSRLPKKVMAKLSGVPMIKHIYDLCKNCNYVDDVIVATSVEQSDDELFEYCVKNKIKIYRGSLENVLSRFVAIINKYNPKFVVRITGDCPFIYPTFIDKQIKIMTESNADFVKTFNEANILCGQGVHSAESLRNILDNSNDLNDFEHVGSPYLNENHHKFKIVGLSIPKILENCKYRLTVDEKEDLKIAKIIYENLWQNKPVDLISVINWLDSHPEIAKLNFFVNESSINKSIKLLKENTSYKIINFYKWDEI